VRIFYSGLSHSQMMKTGSIYLSQSELPLTFVLGQRDKIDRVQVEWPSGAKEEFKNLPAVKTYQCTESKGFTGLTGF